MKTLFKGLILLFGLLIFTNCQKDDDAVFKNSSSDGINVSTISFEQFKSNSDAFEELEKVRNNTANRSTVYDNKYNFYYEEDEVILIQYDGFKTFTFPIYRTTASNVIENLVIRQDSTGYTDSFIFEYDFKPEDRINVLKNKPVINLRDKFEVRSVEGGEGNPPFIYQDEQGNCYYFTTYEDNVYVGPRFVPIDCPDGYLDYSYTIDDDNGSGSESTESNPVFITPQPEIEGPATDPGWPGGGGGGGSSPGSYPPIITKPAINILVHLFMDTLTVEQTLWLNAAVNKDIKDGLNRLLAGHLDGYNERKDLAEEILDLAIDDNQESALKILDYLDESDFSDESIEVAEEIMQAVDEYYLEYNPDNNEDDIITDFINDVLYPEAEEEEELVLPPSCESFNFVNTTSNWQEAAVANIHFQVTVITPQGMFVNLVVDYPQPILFGCPRNLVVGNTQITPGMAAELSARVLKLSMNQTVSKFGNKPVTSAIVKIYFESRLKHNYPLFIPGARVNVNANNYSVTPTQYQTNAFGTGDCD